jgi:hypothetical protein
MIAFVTAALLASAPAVESAADPGASRQLSFSGALVGAWGLSPGAPISLNLGVRFRWHRFSLGLEVQPLFPGTVAVSTGDLFRQQLRPRDFSSGASVRGLGGAGMAPACLEWGIVSTCVVVAAGALVLDDTPAQALVSAGGRVAGEFPRDSPVRFRASAQLLGGIVRPSAGTFWQTSPVQLGLTLGAVADAL